MAEPVIQIKDLHKYYGAVHAVEGLTLEVNKGEVFGFLGPNGAGKTTTIRCMLNFVFPTSGELRLLNKNPVEHGPQIMKEVGYIAGEIALYDNYRVRDFLNMLEDVRGEKGALRAELLQRFQLDESRKIKNLSKGNKQKVAIVQAFMHLPLLLVLDEPTSGLDPLLQLEFYKLIDETKQRGGTVFFSSHLLEEVQRLSDRAAIIKKGKLISLETISELRSKNIYNVSVHYKGREPKTQDFGAQNVENFTLIDHSAQLTYKGDVNALLEILNNYELVDLRITEPSLEDMFLAYYENDEETADTDKS
ncbi:MAG: putative ABC transporter ATP-binding protein YbhF [candidate division WS6 bacterium OLB20]|uniref:Putative ABC transporter ATP-binding protein YbhF n=1 Tax=candidate division WS6 bacterium OLB20 TaxID=1617426 RepID=A0A136M0Z1_9BACT|nr:MAG: putative ABC transporter ATP-binding protein YbhF [candidate division WS6 bacterium OLB20]